MEYARKKIIKTAQTAKHLSVLRQQKFNGAPGIDPEEMGVIVMPFIEGTNVMAKVVKDHWEFGYCRTGDHKVQSEPYITKTPHDRGLLQVSENLQSFLGFRCEIEYVVAPEGQIHVVQAKDISSIDTLDSRESERSVKLDGVRRIRIRRSYRERPVFVLDQDAFYIELIGRCEDIVLGTTASEEGLQAVIDAIGAYEAQMQAFALRHERFCVLGLSVKPSQELYQIANHYLDDIPRQQRRLSKALLGNQYQTDYFMSEADTLITKDKIRVNLGSHDAYGIDTVRHPIWSVYWRVDQHDRVVKAFKQLGFRSGDLVGIDVAPDGRPTVYRQ